MSHLRESAGSKPSLYEVKKFPSGRFLSQDAISYYQSLNKNLRSEYEKPEKKVEWDKHITQSKAAILDSSKGLTGKALILGMGNAMDIPLAELSRQFDSVTIIEVDQNAAGLALSKLPANQQQKCNLIVDDLTGVVGDATQNVQKAINKNSALSGYINDLSSAIPNIPSQPSKTEHDYSFVCSSLLSSQLVSSIYVYSNNRVHRKYGSYIQQTPDTGKYYKALVDLSVRLQKEHVEMVRSALTDNGRAYMSDTIFKTILIGQPFGEIYMAKSGQPLIAKEAVNSIDDKFIISSEKIWEWRRNPPTNRQIQGDGYIVWASSLTPKPKNPPMKI